MTPNSTLAIHLVSDDIEHSGPLRDAMEAERLPVVDGDGQQAVVVIAVVDVDPWVRGRDLMTDNVRGVLMLCTGHVDQPPADVGDDVVVRHWSDPDTAVMQVVQFFKKKQRQIDETATEPAGEAAPPPAFAAPPPAFAAPPPASGVSAAKPVDTEPELIDDDAVMDADEPKLVNDAQLMGPESAPPPTRPTQVAMPNLESITPEDGEFITRVFNQVKGVDFRSPPPPPPQKKLTGLDKKMHFLREKNRELERDLARVGFVWRVKQQEVNAVEQIVTAKEAERATAVQRYQQIKDQATRAAAQNRAEVEQLTANVNDLEATKNGLKGALQKLKTEHETHVTESTARIEKQEKEKADLVAEFRSKIEEAQGAFNQLRDQSTSAITDANGRQKETNEKLEKTEGELHSTRVTLEQRDKTIGEQAESLTDRQATIDRLTGDLETLRTESAAKIEQLNKEHAEDRARLEGELAEVQQGLAATRQELEQTQAVVVERDKAISALQDTAAATKTETDSKLAGFDAEIGSTRQALEQAKGTLIDREKTLSTLTNEIASARHSFDERISELKGTIAARDKRVAELEGEVSSARIEFAQIAEELKKHREDAGRMSEELAQNLADARADGRASKNKIAELESQLAHREADLAAKESEIHGAREEGRRAKEDLDRLVAETKSAKFRVEELEQQTATRENVLAQAQSALQAAQEETRLARTDAEAIGQKLAELEAGGGG